MEATTQNDSIDVLIDAVQRLSLAETLEDVQAVVRTGARELTGADGATFVLRDREFCHYADEDAIEPLWKGERFPLSACISGWAMLNRKPAVIEDIYSDERVPHEAYRPTFVKSLAMVPIRSLDPIGAIGNYWASRHRPTSREVSLLQSLADATAVAMENVSLAEGSQVDSLTGVATRREFFETAGRRFAEARASGGRCTVGFADVDGLKGVNDTFGHDVGSEVIRDAAGALSETMGPDAVVGRLGGDEFAVYLDGAVDPDELRARLTATSDQLNAARTDLPPISISFGAVTAWADAADSLDRVLAAADQRMYQDKRDPGRPRLESPLRRSPRDES
jgi:diguanylate cyclase (GGDEF)-like protein